MVMIWLTRIIVLVVIMGIVVVYLRLATASDPSHVPR